jgi:uncharacterized damage-inducible protein DinB
MNNEITNYLEWIDHLRAQASEIVADLPMAALNWRPVTAGDDHATNSLAVLAAHVAGSEHFWIYEVIGRKPATRNRDAEFVTEADDAQSLVNRLAQSAQETREILTALSADSLDETRTLPERTYSVRWCIIHVIEHTSLHLGHMQLTKQLWQAAQNGR